MSEVVPGGDVAADQHSFEAAFAAAMAAVGQEAPAAQASVQPEVVQSSAASENSGQAAQPDKPAATPDPGPTAPSAKELERIAALDAREAKVREAEGRAKALEAREAALAEREARSSKQWDAFVSDPVGHIKSMRPELSSSEAAQVAEQVYFYALGDKAPPEHRQRQEVAKAKTEISSEVEKLRAEIQELRESRSRMEQEQQVAAYRAELRTGAADASDAPIVAGLIKRNPARAEEMLFEVARLAAVESSKAGDKEPVVLKPAEAVAKLEAILKAQRDELFGPAPVESKPEPNVQQSKPSTTISNRDASIQPNRAAPDPDDDRALRKAALEAAGLGHIPVW